MRSGRWRGAIAVTMTWLAAGCGTSPAPGEQGKDATAILADSVQALRRAGPLHMRGDITTSESVGSSPTRSHILLDLDIASKGNVAGTFTIDGASVRVTTSAGNTYLAGRDFWAMAKPEAAALFGDRCVLVPPTFTGATSILSAIDQLSDLNTLADGLSKPKGTVTKGSATSVDGVAAITVRDSESALYVAATGTPYPLRLEMSGSDSGRIDLRYDRRFAITPPADCIDASKLAGSG